MNIHQSQRTTYCATGKFIRYTDLGWRRNGLPQHSCINSRLASTETNSTTLDDGNKILISTEETNNVTPSSAGVASPCSSLSSRSLSSEVQSDGTPTDDNQNVCKFCGEKFASRNAVFRHIRTSVDCHQSQQQYSTSLSLGEDNKSEYLELPKRMAVIQFGYSVVPAGERDEQDIGDEQNFDLRRRGNEVAATLVANAYIAVLQSKIPLQQKKDKDGNRGLLQITQTSACKPRHQCLEQDHDCNAVGDVICLTYRGGNIQQVIDTSSLVNEVQLQLKGPLALESDIDALEYRVNDVRVHAIEHLPASARFHAESGCTQRIYHYLLPLAWFGDAGRDVENWLSSHQQDLKSIPGWERIHQQHGKLPTPKLLIELKRALSFVESRHCGDGDSGDDSSEDIQSHGKAKNENIVASPGRFGSLWKKERRCWHNFADSLLAGKASPNHEGVWRTIDRARIADYCLYPVTRQVGETKQEQQQQVVAVIELVGDGFVRGQIQSIMGSVVAIVNGLLPKNFFEVATRPDVYIETPVAPPRHTYLAGARFHFHELTQGGRHLFKEYTPNKDVSVAGEKGLANAEQWMLELRSNMLESFLQSNEHFENGSEVVAGSSDDAWRIALHDTISPRIRAQLDAIVFMDEKRKHKAKLQDASRGDIDLLNANSAIAMMEPCPEIYNNTLELLRSVADDKSWPRTSLARSRVIRSVTSNDDGKTRTMSPFVKKQSQKKPTIRSNIMTTSTSSSFFGEFFQSGSFTVVNENLVKEKLPLANELFPDLVKSVFELERLIISNGAIQIADGCKHKNLSIANRSLSTHCAINRNAEFIPHVDSGRGAGQSISMIVGLGDYAKGGSLFVEGMAHDIRYKPLAFDGWKQRHWTEPFDGERFSLVWFTPEPTTKAVVMKDKLNHILMEGNLTECGPTNAFVRNEDKRAEMNVAAAMKELEATKWNGQVFVNPTIFEPLKFRRNSTDSLVINEILDADQGRIYENYENDFILQGHHKVLDIGAHIGVFTWFALSRGCKHVIAYEPAPSNLELLRENVRFCCAENITMGTALNQQRVIIYPSAVAHGEVGTRTLVEGRNRSDGLLNTWRHALSEYNHYLDKSNSSAPLSSSFRRSKLRRSRVSTVPLFGSYGALQVGITFVKMDCEGAEIDILLSESARSSSSWLDVTHLVFEWSFTKERRVSKFHQALSNLMEAGFQVFYEGQGSWWDTELNVIWPFHNDLVVFAKRPTNHNNRTTLNFVAPANRRFHR